jgi:hypothetical protein
MELNIVFCYLTARALMPMIRRYDLSQRSNFISMQFFSLLGLVWKLKYPSGLKGIGEEISSFPLQSRRGFEVPNVALTGHLFPSNWKNTNHCWHFSSFTGHLQHSDILIGCPTIEHVHI